VHQHYIRLVLDLDNATLAHHDEDDEPVPPGEKQTRMVICMSADSSASLQKTQYLQNDIAFKRVVDYDEFEIAGMDRDANTSELPQLLPSLLFSLHRPHPPRRRRILSCLSHPSHGRSPPDNLPRNQQDRRPRHRAATPMATFAWSASR
jgi:hypothetical protein